MAAFTTALDIQAAATLSTCQTAHAEYEALKKEVASNVVSRKQVYIAALVIKCYVDNMTDNAAAKKCADSRRSASTTKFDITPPGLAPCSSKAKNVDSYGPASWKPTASNCRSDSNVSLMARSGMTAIPPLAVAFPRAAGSAPTARPATVASHTIQPGLELKA